MADKFTVFADKLSIPTSLTFANGGVIVHQAPHTLFLKDTDGDGKADVRKVLFTGWGTRDTHAGPSNLRYGFDNWIYGIVGYSGFDGTVGGERHRFRQGFYRFKLERTTTEAVSATKLEFLRSTNNNSWGVGFSEEGLALRLDRQRLPERLPADPQPLLRSGPRLVVDGAAEHRRRATSFTRSPTRCGRSTGTAASPRPPATRSTRPATYPKEYWNRTAFVAEPTGHLVATFVLRPEAARTSRLSYGWNLVASDDEWTAPIMAEVGPDGNVWVHRLVQLHRPAQPDARRLQDRQGQRLRDRAARQEARPHLPARADGPEGRTVHRWRAATMPQLVAALKNPTMHVAAARAATAGRTQKRLTSSGALSELVADQSVDEVGLNVGAIHALWTSQASAICPAGDARAGRHRRPGSSTRRGVRRAAIAGMPPTKLNRRRKSPSALSLLQDPDPQVRLASLLASSDVPAQRAGRPIHRGRIAGSSQSDGPLAARRR